MTGAGVGIIRLGDFSHEIDLAASELPMECLCSAKASVLLHRDFVITLYGLDREQIKIITDESSCYILQPKDPMCMPISGVNDKAMIEAVITAFEPAKLRAWIENSIEMSRDNPQFEHEVDRLYMGYRAIYWDFIPTWKKTKDYDWID